MIDREQVLHVAKLARLSLDEAEVKQMASELSGVLSHIEQISQLDLDGVQPTTHVLATGSSLREDKPVTSLDKKVALSQAPSGAEGDFKVPSPGA